ncbi:MAG: ABC transporter permease [Eubacteriales bacterium]|nr:ABC transporter permease [Eubacteriales bacterium]
MIRKNLRLPQLIIAGFMLCLFATAHMLGFNMKTLISTSFTKFAMNGVMVLAMIPMLKAGAGLNFGLPIGIISGLVGMCLSIQLRLSGMGGFFCALLFTLPVALFFGFLYALILDHVKGKEDIAAIFIGYSVIPLMDFFWTVAPFTNREMLYPIGGSGLRPKISLENYFGSVLDNLWSFELAGLTIPTGLLLFYSLIALLLFLFFKTRTGEAMEALGQNEDFCYLAGIPVKKIRHLAIILSTLIGGVGIIVYAQSYGFVELYNGPSGFAFPAVSSIIIGGYIGKESGVFQAMLGTYLYQTIYLLSSPIANAVLIPELSEITRMIVTNGIILYAFLQQNRRKHD